MPRGVKVASRDYQLCLMQPHNHLQKRDNLIHSKGDSHLKESAGSTNKTLVIYTNKNAERMVQIGLCGVTDSNVKDTNYTPWKHLCLFKFWRVFIEISQKTSCCCIFLNLPVIKMEGVRLCRNFINMFSPAVTDLTVY